MHCIFQLSSWDRRKILSSKYTEMFTVVQSWNKIQFIYLLTGCYNKNVFCGPFNVNPRLTLDQPSFCRGGYWLNDKYTIGSALSRKLSDTTQLVGFCPVVNKYDWVGFYGKLNDKLQFVGFCPGGETTSTTGSAFYGKLNDKLQLVSFCPGGETTSTTRSAFYG